MVLISAYRLFTNDVHPFSHGKNDSIIKIFCQGRKGPLLVKRHAEWEIYCYFSDGTVGKATL